MKSLEVWENSINKRKNFLDRQNEVLGQQLSELEMEKERLIVAYEELKEEIQAYKDVITAPPVKIPDLETKKAIIASPVLDLDDDAPMRPAEVPKEKKLALDPKIFDKLR